MTEETTNPAHRLLGNAVRICERVLNALFLPSFDRFSRLLNGVIILLLFAGGVVLWGNFFSWGNLSFDFLDWAEVTGPRYALLRDAALKGVFPLHAGNITALRGVTDRYFSIGDTPFSPQYLLLRFLEPGQYIFFDTLLFYSIGFLGLLIIFFRFRLSPFAFSLLFLLFNFNGNLTSHLAVGHSIWVAHFLIPYFVLLVLDLFQKEKVGWRWVLGFTTLEVVIIAQGGFHLFFWCLLWLGVTGLFNWRLIKPVFLGGLFTGLATLPRLLPPSLVLREVTNEYLGGFPSITDMFDGLIVLRDPDHTNRIFTNIFPLNAWETDFFVGMLGLVFILIFGVFLPFRAARSKYTVDIQVLLISFIFVVLSVGKVFALVVKVFPVPPFTAERVSSRLLILPLVFCLVLAVIYLQRELTTRRFPAWIQLILIGMEGLLFHDLLQHFLAWRIRYLDSLVQIYPKVAFDPTQHTLANHADPIYFNMLIAGTVVAALAFLFLIIMAARRQTIVR